MGVSQYPKRESRPQFGWGTLSAMPAKARAVDLKPDVGRRLRAARSILYASSDACARDFQIPVNTWRNYETGERYPDPWHLNRFCDETGFTTDFIYRGRMRGIKEDVQIRLAAEYPALVDEAPDVVSPSRARAPV
jgi:hypothetical protein